MKLPGITDVVASVLETVRKGVDDVVTSKEERMQLENSIREAELQAKLAAMKMEVDLASSRKEILLAEINGKSWLQRNVRPLFMLVVEIILFNNFVLAPYIPGVNVLTLPPEMWGLFTVAVGGYIGVRTWEKRKGMHEVSVPAPKEAEVEEEADFNDLKKMNVRPPKSL